MANYNLFDAASLAMIPVGSKEGKVYSIKPEPVYGSELVTNGDFATNLSGWNNKSSTSTWVSGSARVDNSIGNASSGIFQDVGLVLGKTYTLTATLKLLSADSNGNFVVLTSNSAGGSQTFIYTGAALIIGGSSVTETIQFTHADADVSIQFACNTTNAIIEIDNVSVKEVLTSSGDFTFSRGSNLAATRVSADGLIEKGRENLLLQSNQFDTTWNLQNLSVASGQSGYDGSSDAWKLTPSTSNTYHRLTNVVSGAANSVINLSVYAKADGYNFIRISENASTGDYATFNLTDGSVESNTGISNTATTTSVGNGWYRCSFSVNVGTTTRFDIYLMESASVQQPWSGNGTDGILIQDAQVEVGLAATDVIETTTTTGTAGILERTPRLDYSNGASCPSLLLEPSRTNRIVQSEYFGDSLWNGGQSRDYNLTYTNELTPQGLAGSYKYESTASNNQLGAITNTSIGTTITNSIYVKRVSGTGNVKLRNVNNAHTDFSLSVADGWKRIDVTGIMTSTTARFYVNLDDVGDEILIWGAQQEAGSYSTSLIPTYGSAVTRAADVCGDAGDANTFNSTEGVLYAEIAALDNTQSASQYITISDGTYNNRLSILYSNGATNSIRAFLRVGGASQVDFSASIGNQKSFNKIAFKYKQNDFSLWVNGIEVATDTSGSTVSSDTLDELSFSEIGTSAGLFNGKVKQVLTFNTALLDTELAALTLRYENYQEWVTGERLTWESPSCTNNNITELKNL